MADISFAVMLSSGNAAFDESPELELARIIRALAGRIEQGATGTITLHDFNGNKVGVANLDIRSNANA